MQLEIYESLTTSLIEEIEEFLLNSESKFNPLFSIIPQELRQKKKGVL